MKPQARVQALIDILDAVRVSRVPMDLICGDYFRNRRYIGSKDRAWVAEKIYDVMRHHARIGWHLDHAKANDTPRNRVLAFLSMYDGADQKRLKDLCDGSKYAPEPLSEDELAMIGGFNPDATLPEDIEVECPDLYKDSLQNYFGQGFVDEMVAMHSPATLDLRVNLLKCTVEKAKAYLEADGIPTDPTPHSPWGLRCHKKSYLSKSKAFAKGWIEIQDEGSQLIALQCGAEPGMQVLDYCAGAGGKTLALAGMMQNKGRIVAMDIDARRLEKSRQRFRKAAAADIIEVRPLSDEKHKKWLRRQKEKFDIVLCDVPCTGTGTWRRNPDMRWTVYGPPLKELQAIQAEILEKVAGAVKHGGKLVYATCSLLPEENEHQIEEFLKNNPEFAVLKSENSVLGDPYMRLTPHRHQTDGFFAAILKKT